MRTALIIIFIVSFILITGCTAPFSVFDNDPSLPNEVVNITTVYAKDGINNINLPRSGNYSIHAETINRGYSATLGYQYSTKSPNDRFGDTGQSITHGWKSLASPEGYIGYSNENSILDATFTIPPNAIDSAIIIFCKSNKNTVAIIQPCGTRISITRLP